MQNGLIKVLWVLSSSVLMVGGLLLISNPYVNLVSVSVIYTLILYIVGIDNIIVYLANKEILLNPGSVIKEGLAGMLLAVILYFNSQVTSTLIPYFFGVYLLYRAVNIYISLDKTKKINSKVFILNLFSGSITIISGFILLLNQLFTTYTLNIVFGIILIIQGYLEIERLFYNLRFQYLLKKNINHS